MQPGEHRPVAVGLADDDGQVLDAAVARPEGDDAGLRRPGQRHLRLRHRAQRARRGLLVGQHLGHGDPEQVLPLGRQASVAGQAGHHGGGQQARQLGQGHGAGDRRVRLGGGHDKSGRKIAGVRRAGIGEPAHRGGVEAGGHLDDDHRAARLGQPQHGGAPAGDRQGQRATAQGFQAGHRLRCRRLGGLCGDGVAGGIADDDGAPAAQLGQRAVDRLQRGRRGRDGFGGDGQRSGHRLRSSAPIGGATSGCFTGIGRAACLY